MSQTDTPLEPIQEQQITRKCFVIMPIAELESYGDGHFSRVYEYIIKPACLKAGFIPIRADEVKEANVIVLDILKKILECDMAICDLSSRNANVFYELGIRHAFDLPVVLIKDKITSRAFDISHLRDEEYDHLMRIDNVNESVERISQKLTHTYNSHHSDMGKINSLISMLGITAAQTVAHPVSTETKMILDSIENMSKRLLDVEDSINPVFHSVISGNANSLIKSSTSKFFGNFDVSKSNWETNRPSFFTAGNSGGISLSSTEAPNLVVEIKNTKKNDDKKE
jgi:hypothetical protein